MRTLFFFLLIASLSPQIATAQKTKKKKKDQVVTLTTPHGNMVLILFDETPKHKENFLKLAESGYYDQTTFHRVINGFMIQGGDPNSRPNGNRKQVGQGGPGYTVEAEFVSAYSHVKGALAAARQSDRVNPEKRSSGSQFYIVQNPNACRHLNGSYTVYGQVIQGLEIIDRIAAQEVNGQKLPLEDIPVSMKVKVMKRKKIKKLYDYHYE